MAMLRTRRDAGDRTPFRIVYSVRRPEDQLYVDDLDRLAAATTVSTSTWSTPARPRSARCAGPAASSGASSPRGAGAEIEPACFVCGPTGFVEAVARQLVALGHDPARIKTERFGPAVD